MCLNTLEVGSMVVSGAGVSGDVTVICQALLTFVVVSPALISFTQNPRYLDTRIGRDLCFEIYGPCQGEIVADRLRPDIVSL